MHKIVNLRIFVCIKNLKIECLKKIEHIFVFICERYLSKKLFSKVTIFSMFSNYLFCWLKIAFYNGSHWVWSKKNWKIFWDSHVIYWLNSVGFGDKSVSIIKSSWTSLGIIKTRNAFQIKKIVALCTVFKNKCYLSLTPMRL